MGTLTVGHDNFEILWASDIAFDGIPLEVSDHAGALWFDVSVPEGGAVTVNTFAREVPADLILAAVELARRRR